MVEGSNPFEPVESRLCGGIRIEFSILDHVMVPEHRILDDDEVEEVLSKYDIEKERLSKIQVTDPVVKEISANAGDIIEIRRKSETAGSSLFYRLVIE